MLYLTLSFSKNHVKVSRFDQKNKIQTLKLYFVYQTHSLCDSVHDVISYEAIRFSKYYLVLMLYVKLFEKKNCQWAGLSRLLRCLLAP